LAAGGVAPAPLTPIGAAPPPELRARPWPVAFLSARPAAMVLNEGRTGAASRPPAPLIHAAGASMASAGGAASAPAAAAGPSSAGAAAPEDGPGPGTGATATGGGWAVSAAASDGACHESAVHSGRARIGTTGGGRQHCPARAAPAARLGEGTAPPPHHPLQRPPAQAPLAAPRPPGPAPRRPRQAASPIPWAPPPLAWGLQLLQGPAPPARRPGPLHSAQREVRQRLSTSLPPCNRLSIKNGLREPIPRQSAVDRRPSAPPIFRSMRTGRAPACCAAGQG
jgi:hypothetical protein